MARAAASAASICAGVATDARDTMCTPSGKEKRTWAATCNASLVLPLPAGPVIVTSRQSGSASISRRSLPISVFRPTKGTAWAGSE